MKNERSTRPETICLVLRVFALILVLCALAAALSGCSRIKSLLFKHDKETSEEETEATEIVNDSVYTINNTDELFDFSVFDEQTATAGCLSVPTSDYII